MMLIIFGDPLGTNIKKGYHTLVNNNYDSLRHHQPSDEVAASKVEQGPSATVTAHTVK